MQYQKFNLVSSDLSVNLERTYNKKPAGFFAYIGIQAFFITVGTAFLCTAPVAAGDLLFQLTSPAYNESIAIGQILSKSEDRIVFKRSRVLLGKRLPRTVSITDFTASQIESLSSGDFAVLSLNKSSNKKDYRLNYDAFETNSPRPDGATILLGPLSGTDREAYGWFLNSCGRDREFSFDYTGKNNTVLVKDSDGKQRVIATLDGDGWERVIDPSMCKPDGLSWWYSFLDWLGFSE